MAIIDLRRYRPKPQPSQEDLAYQEFLQGMNALASAIPKYAQQEQLAAEKQRKEQEKLQKEQQRIMQDVELLKIQYPNLSDSQALELAQAEKGPIKTAFLKELGKPQTWPQYLGFSPPSGAQQWLQGNAPQYQAAEQALQQAMGGQAPQVPTALQGLIGSQQQRQAAEGMPVETPQAQIDPRIIQNIVSEAEYRGIPVEQQVADMVERGTINENAAQTVLRNVARAGARAGEEFVQATPNIISWLGEKFTQGLRGLKSAGKQPGGLLGQDMTVAQERERFAKAEKERAAKPLNFPRLDLKKSVTDEIEKRYLPKDYLQPQSEAERNIDEFAGTVGAILSPFPGGIGAKIPGTSIKLADKVGRSIGISGAGQIAKWGAQKLGANEDLQQLAKGGAMLTAGLLGPRVAERIGAARMKSGKEGIAKAKNSSIKANRLNDFIETYDRGLSTGKFKPDTQLKNQVKTMGLQEISPSVRRLVDIPLDELLDFRENLNRFAREATNQSSKAFVSKLKDPLDKAIQSAGKGSKALLDSINQYYNGAELFKASKDQAPIVDYIKRWTTPRKMSSLATAAIFGGGLGAGFKAGITSLAARGIAAPLIDNVIRAFKYPAVRKLYANVIANVLAKNKAGTQRAVEQFDKVIQKYGKD